MKINVNREIPRDDCFLLATREAIEWELNDDIYKNEEWKFKFWI